MMSAVGQLTLELDRVADAKQKKRERNRRYRDKNKDKIAECQSLYRERRFFRIKVTSLNHRHKGDGVPVATAQELASLWHRQRGRCALSGLRLTRETAHLDHIVPKSKGGTGEIGNLQWVHKIMNQAKGDLSQEEFLSIIQKAAFAQAC